MTFEYVVLPYFSQLMSAFFLAERTARYFANLFRSRELTDVIIYVGEHKVKTHKLVLAAFSPRFNKQFMKERPEHLLMPEVCIDVSQLQTRALLRCIEFMYKGTTEIHHYNAAVNTAITYLPERRFVFIHAFYS